MAVASGIPFRDPAASDNPALLFWSRDEEEVGVDIRTKRKFRSQKWFDNQNHPAITAYVECYQIWECTHRPSGRLSDLHPAPLHVAVGVRGSAGAFLAAARRQGARDRTLCETLHFTGCRPSELLEITSARVDLSGGTVTIRSLKKRKDAKGATKVVYRSVPVPPDYLDTLNTAHGLREAARSRERAAMPIWPISRVRVWQLVKGIMIEAGIADGPHRSPKGLRHGFGINAMMNGIPLHMLQKWMGHAQLSTTAIYADAVGKEEQDIAARMWG